MTSPTPGQPATALPVLAAYGESRAALAALARDWIADCQWDDLDGEDVPDLTDDEALAAIARHYDGGLQAFTLDCQPSDSAPQANPPLTAERKPPMDASTCADTKIVIRDLRHYGDDLTVPDAIARLCGGTWVAVTVTDSAPPGGDPRSWTDITICPIGTTARPEPPRVASGGDAPGSCPADAAAWYAEALMLASQIAAFASLGQAALGRTTATPWPAPNRRTSPRLAGRPGPRRRASPATAPPRPAAPARPAPSRPVKKENR